MRGRRLLMAAAAAMVSAGLARAGEAPGETRAKAPRIAVEPARFDFGRVLPGKTLAKEFTIRNHGRGELVIEGVSTTCDCAAALSAHTRVRPGGSAPLRVTLDTLDSAGRIRRLVRLRSNDPARPTVELKLEATVVRPDGERAE